METNLIIPPYYVVTETFFNYNCYEASESTHFEGYPLLTCRKMAIEYCISQLEQFNSGGVSVDEDIEPSDDWWLKFENVEGYQSYLYLVVGDKEIPIGCADEYAEEGPIKLEQLKALQIETEELINATVTR